MTASYQAHLVPASQLDSFLRELEPGDQPDIQPATTREEETPGTPARSSHERNLPLTRTCTVISWLVIVRRAEPMRERTYPSETVVNEPFPFPYYPPPS